MRRVVPILPCLRAWLDAWIPLGVEPVPINFGRRWRRMKAEAGLRRPNRVEKKPSDSTGKT